MQRVIMVIKIFLKICAIVSSVKKPAIKLQKKNIKKEREKGKEILVGFALYAWKTVSRIVTCY